MKNKYKKYGFLKVKLNQKILYAINEGIRKSLLSFDDVQFDQTTSANINQKNRKQIKKLEYIQKGFVDLGLPSETLWCKFNLGATGGDTKNTWLGNYYAWGETQPKDRYGKTNYMCNEMIELTTGDDAAYQTNDYMRIPTREQINELMQLPRKMVKNYNGVKGLHGILLTGYNNIEIFFPYTGYYDKGTSSPSGKDMRKDRESSYVWINQLSDGDPNFAIYFTIHDTEWGPRALVMAKPRYFGLPIRPVANI